MTTTYNTTTAVLPQPRRTYSQDWAKYNVARTHEQEHFVTLLRDLCDTIEQPPQTFGRPRLPLSDVIFGIALKVYSTMSGRRAMSGFRNAEANGLMSKAPSFTSTFRYLENPELAPLLKSLIEQSALPLKSVETDFAVDSSGFSTSVYHRWFDHKWGKVIKEAQWVKCHLMCGVTTNIVTEPILSRACAPTAGSDRLRSNTRAPMRRNVVFEHLRIAILNSSRQTGRRGTMIRSIGRSPITQ